MFVRSAVSWFNIPWSLKAKIEWKIIQREPSTILKTKEEIVLKHFIIHCAKNGFPRLKRYLTEHINEFLEKQPKVK